MLVDNMAQTVSRVLARQLALSHNVVVLLKGLLVDPLVKHHLNALLIPHLQSTSKSMPAGMEMAGRASHAALHYCQAGRQSVANLCLCCSPADTL